MDEWRSFAAAWATWLCVALVVMWAASACGATDGTRAPLGDTSGQDSVASDAFGAEISDPCAGVLCGLGKTCQNGECLTSSRDNDGDGFTLAEDCNDLDPAVYPTASEVCDGVDNDCDFMIDEGFDADLDGYATCATPSHAGDCDDSDPAINPGATEACDGLDNDCNGQVDEGADNDGDGFSGCDADPTKVDCDDHDVSVFPGAPELCDLIDNDCDAQVDEGNACVGCSDGQRDDLADVGRWRTVAACRGSFARQSLRAQRTNTACGDDLGAACPAPEDLCAPGWHICMRNGLSTDLRFRLEAADCRGLSATYVAATNNCSNSPDVSPATTGCNTSEPYGCYPTGWCSAPVACGPTETSHCAHAVWPNATRIFGLHAGRTDGNGCASISTDVSYGYGGLAGVLCCLD